MTRYHRRVLAAGCALALAAACVVRNSSRGGHEQPCLDDGRCASGLTCHTATDRCLLPAEYCAAASIECGQAPGRDFYCGTCAGETDICTAEGRCQDDCALLECGFSPVAFYRCGHCAEAEHGCIDGRCVPLDWQDEPAATRMGWQAARDYCDALDLAGRDDWRLPTIDELQSLIHGCTPVMTGGWCGVGDDCLSHADCFDSRCTGCAQDRGPADGCYWPVGIPGPCGPYWSASPCDDARDEAWIVEFSYAGLSHSIQHSAAHYVRCVRPDADTCTEDADCPAGRVCSDGICSPAPCQSRADCAGPVCLVCRDGLCVEPPEVCQSDRDCCVGFVCNFGTCIPDEPEGCQSDSDCEDPEFPRCNTDTGECIPECVNDIDCPLADQICQDNHCVSPGCSPEDCPQGQWCNTGSGECEPGCDSNDDCVPPATCNYQTHECGQVDCCGGVCTEEQYCDGLTCQCVDLCQDDTDCPPAFDCDVESGRCLCTEGDCPQGSHCDLQTGACVRDGDACQSDADCPNGATCDPAQQVCVPQGTQAEGEACFRDAECDAGAGLLCDSALFCTGCMISDPDFEPTFTCRLECSLMMPDCPGGHECLYRHPELKGLCMPTGP